MNFLLSPQTFDCVYSVVKENDSVFYLNEPPKQIMDFLNKYKIKHFQTNTMPSPNRTVFAKDIKSEWPTEDLDSYARKSYYIKSMSNIPYLDDIDGDFDIYFTDKKLLEKLENYNNVNYVDDFSQTPKTTYLVKEHYDSDNYFDKNNCYCLQYLSSEKDKTKNYRRFKLNKYLKVMNKVDTIYTGSLSSVNKNKNYKVVYISDPRGATPIVDYFKGKALIVYDHTDNWGFDLGYAYDEQEYCIKNADIIFTSANFLYNYVKSDTDNKNVYLIPNGCDVKEYIPGDIKYNKKAIYIGKANNKINFNLLKSLASEGWTIDLYGVPKPAKFEAESVNFNDFIDEVHLHEVIQKYNVGLIPFNGDLWTDGMLPLKFFHYVNAHIPTAYYNCDEVSCYSKVAFDLKDYSIDEIANMKIDDEEYNKILAISNWKEKFDKMFKIINSELNNR